MYIHRLNQNTLYSAFESHFVTAVLGPRQIGKSTLISNYHDLHQNYRWVTLNMDSLVERNRVEQSQLQELIEEKAEQRIGQSPKIWVIIEEAQKCPALFDQIKIIYDHFKKKDAIKFILTGSGSLNLHQLSAESLAGRIQLFHLDEFNLRECASLKSGKQLPSCSILEAIYENSQAQQINHFIKELSPFRPLLTNTLNKQLIWGGLPELFSLPFDGEKLNRERLNYLANYLQTYLEKDVRPIATITDLHLYRKLIDVIAEQTGSLRQDTQIQKALGNCHVETLKKYRGFLEATLMYKEVYPYITSALKRYVKSPKAYLTNNGLISFVTGLHDLSVLVKSGLIGRRLENWFLKELQVSLSRSPARNQIDFWRSHTHLEIDFIVVKPPYIYPFEITYSNKIDDKKLKHLRLFLEQERKAKHGYFIYRGEFKYDATSRIYFLPTWAIG